MQPVTIDEPLALAAPASADGVWAPQRRRLTLGLVLTITPRGLRGARHLDGHAGRRRRLGGLGLYGWVFSGFFLGNLLGIVLAGEAADRRGTALPFAAGLVLFSIGLLAGGLAPSMGPARPGSGGSGHRRRGYPRHRLRQRRAGLPAGGAPAGVRHLLLGLGHPRARRAGGEQRHRRRRELEGRVPRPAPVRRARRGHHHPHALAHRSARPGGRRHPVDDRRRQGVLLTVGVGLVLGAISGPPIVLAIPLAVVGVPVAFRSFLGLVPEGTLRLAPGIPAAVLVRGILTFAFFGTDAYVSLAFQEVRGQETWVAGLSLTICTLCWTAASWVQERWIHRLGPRRVVAAGFGILIVAIVLMFGVLGPLPIPLAIGVWGVGGFAIGLAYSPLSVTVLGLAAPGKEGSASASLQLTDVLGIALGTGLVGAFVALGEARHWATRSALEIAFTCTLAVAIAGLAAARRLPSTLPS